MFGYDLGIDLGSSSVIISVPGKRIMLEEPTYVAYKVEDEKMLYAGKRAYLMEGREPDGIKVTCPITRGVIGNYSLCVQMLKHFIDKVLGKSLFKPRIVASIPTITTDVEKRTIISVLISAGARSVCLVEEPLVAAFGAGVDPLQPEGAFVIDIGAGTTDMAVISQGSMNQLETVKIAGNDFDNEIIKYLKEKYSLLIGVRTAEEVKINVACAITRVEDVKTFVKGQDTVTGLPKEMEIGGNDIYKCLWPLFRDIASVASQMFERTSPQLVADITTNSVILTGGSSLIYGIDTLFSNALEVGVRVANDPLHSVAKGTEVALDKMHILDKYGYRYKTKDDVRIR